MTTSIKKEQQEKQWPQLFTMLVSVKQSIVTSRDVTAMENLLSPLS